MPTEIVPLCGEHLDRLEFYDHDSRRAYFSLGSTALCLMSDGEPVFAGGIVNLKWNRGEAWILPTPFLKAHTKVCLKALREQLPRIAETGQFKRVQAVCAKGISARIFMSLGFDYEGTMKKFGPKGETCDMYARIFDGIMEQKP